MAAHLDNPASKRMHRERYDTGTQHIQDVRDMVRRDALDNLLDHVVCVGIADAAEHLRMGRPGRVREEGGIRYRCFMA